MRLAYTAYDKTGRLFTDTIDSANALEASEELRRRGLFVAKIDADEDGGQRRARGGGVGLGGTGRRLKNLATFTRQLHVLLSTGTPVVDALRAVERQARDVRWRAAIQTLRNDVEQGAPLSEALAKQPRHFDAIFTSLIAAGESAGKLPEVLDRLGTLVRKQQHVRSSVLGALIYPALLICVAIGVLVMMVTFVLPRFTDMFAMLDVPLPPSTEALMWISAVMRGFWWAILPACVAVGVGLAVWQSSESGRHLRNTVMLNLPILGPILRNFASARIARLFGILLDSYLPMQEVLGHIRASTPNAHYRALIDDAEDRLTKGQPVSDAFDNPKLVNISVYEAIRNGEETGQLAALTLTIADFMDEENDVIVKSLTSILEPVILIGMGLLIGFVAVSMFLPLFDLSAMSGG